MDSSFINEDVSINASISCIHDSSVGYQADFSVNGDVNGWEYYDGIHTYGCWGGFLFGTIYGNYGIIGRNEVFLPVDASTHRFIRITMKYTPAERSSKGIHPLPTQGKIRWVTLSSPTYSSDKEITFTLYPDNEWHTYVINAATKQYWQGDVNNLRIWPAIDYAEDGDEFFIRAIDIFSISNNNCNNSQCDKYSEYSHPCPWIGKRASIESEVHPANSTFNIADDSELIININEYGNEIVKINNIVNATGHEVANALSKNISQTDVGGYAEAVVEYTDNNTFKIYTGTITVDSTIEIIDNDLARQLKFFNILGENISTLESGEDPASGYSPLSSFKIKTFQLYNLLDSNANSSLTFNPFSYSVEGGRQDWNESSLGLMSSTVGTIEADENQLTVREYYKINNAGKTIIDFNHPFNASGKIKKIWAQCTLDGDYERGLYESARKSQELSDAKILIVRPKRDGTMSVIYQWDLNDRPSNRSSGSVLYSVTQESITLDVDVVVNKGDLLAVYNANMYAGKSISGNEYDARFYQVDGLVSGNFNPGSLYGDGNSGLLIYARGDDTQKRLYAEIDLKRRYNLESINVNAQTTSSILEYNIARCLDINWQCDLFGKYHYTQYYRTFIPEGPWVFRRPNTYYGLGNLNDGVYTVPDGKACDSFTVTYNSSSTSMYIAEAGPGIIPSNPYYFWVNGDEEWLGIWLHVSTLFYGQTVYDFAEDPIEFTLTFPYNKTKKIYKSKIYFKEKSNFRSFSLSTYGGPYYNIGDSDDPAYDLIPEYTKVILDGKEYYKDGPGYDNVDKYLFVNPCVGNAILEQNGPTVYEWDPIYSDLIITYGGEGSSGFFTRSQGSITNYDQFEQARNLNWNILEHQWEPIECHGFRFYCNYHQSTKITEFELYGMAEDVGSALAGGLIVNHSEYGEVWWPSEITQTDENNVDVYIGSSPRYLTLELVPINETIYYDISLLVKTEDSYIGTKGCDYVNLIEHSKLGATNSSQKIDLKNVYGKPYDLYVDIKKEVLNKDGVVYFSRLNNAISVANPTIGADGLYFKQYDYRILNDNYNVAINCDVYGLNNLIDGKKAYYSRNDGLAWKYFGELSAGTSLDFSNIGNIDRSVLNLPVISRNRYWKLYFPNYDISIVEAEVYDNLGERLYPDFYHDSGLDIYDGPISYRAPHISNDSVTGSYYTVNDNYSLGIDTGSQKSLASLVLYHNTLGCDIYTIDENIGMYITGEDITDRSYHEHQFTINGSVIADGTAAGLKLGKPSLYFNGSSYIECPANSDAFSFSTYYYTVDFFVKFESLPSAGQEAVLFQCWGNGTGPRWKVIYIDGSIKFRWANTGPETGGGVNITPTLNVWYHIALARGSYNLPATSFASYIDGVVQAIGGSSSVADHGMCYKKFEAGINFNGWLSHVRVSAGPEWCGSKVMYLGNPFPVPTESAKRKYQFDVYVSLDNINYGYYGSSDLYGGSYYVSGTELETQYYEYLAIDLEKRYSLDIIRDYGVAGAYSISKTSNTSFSADDVSDINLANFNSTYDDARWVRINIPSWDGTTRTIRKVGVYSEITKVLSPTEEYHNNEWTSLSSSITNYSTPINLALDSTVSGSSQLIPYVVENITNGIVNDDRFQAWLSDNSAEQWVLIDLGGEYEIYRVRIYHGFDTENYSNYYAEDYRVETSLDNQSFTTIFNIANNTSLERTHDLAEPVTTRYIRIYITDYNVPSSQYKIQDPDTLEFIYWQGVALREVEVYKYQGYNSISSEEYPIIAINLKEQFYIQGHELIGIYDESSTYDWDNSDSAFAWSDSVSSDPQHPDFSSFGATPNYEQWVAIKRNTATEYGSGPHYLKYAKIQSQDKENPIYYPWWWSSNISTLSRDYDRNVILSTASLRIDYPNSSALDTVSFIEGDDWGIDSAMAYRDGLSFRWYIEDIDKLDLEEGYFYFGGTDGTQSAHDVIYYWNFSTYSGILTSGWNTLFLRFRTADDIDYHTDINYSDRVHPLATDHTTWHTAGMTFKGKGSAFSMNIDGFVVKRNHFNDANRYDYGLYLTGSDYLSAPIGTIDFNAGAIEFWLRPDYNGGGGDFINRYYNRSLFSFGNVANDVFGCLINNNGFIVYFGSVYGELNTLEINTLTFFEIDGLYHIAIVFSNTGENISSDNSTVKVLINNIEIGSAYNTWSINDNKLFKFILGGKPPLAILEDVGNVTTGGVDGVISNLRIYNYCKLDYTDSIAANWSESNTGELIQPSEMIEISSDNVTFYKVDEEGLPLYFPLVPAGDTIPIYVRSIVPKGLSGAEKRTAGIVTMWDIGI